MFWFKSTNKKKKIIKNQNVEKKNKSVFVKVPAKLMISGEHSVIYNHKAVVCAVDLFLNIKIKRISAPKIVITDGRTRIKILLKDLSMEHHHDNKLIEIIRKFFDRIKMPISGMEMIIDNKIPIGCGLGSSSALIVGIIFGINELFGFKKNRNELISIAKDIEKIFHGNSSGADIKTVVIGGVIYVNQGTIEKIPHQIDEIWIINTGRPSFSTKNVVSEIADRFPSSDATWEEMGKITQDISKIMSGFGKVGMKIAHNECCLEKIGVVLPVVKKFLNDIKQHDIYGKICGAGTIAGREKYGGNGIIGIFQVLNKEQKRYLCSLCKTNRFLIRRVFVCNSGIMMTAKQ